MTTLAICSKCYALTPDTDEAVAIHRRKAHTEPAADIERARKAASDAETALKLVRAQMKDYEKALDQRPVPVEPEISMRVVEDDEIEEDPFSDDDIAPEPIPAADHVNAAYSGHDSPISDDEDDEDEDEDEQQTASPSSLYTPGTF